MYAMHVQPYVCNACTTLCILQSCDICALNVFLILVTSEHNFDALNVFLILVTSEHNFDALNVCRVYAREITYQSIIIYLEVSRW